MGELASLVAPLDFISESLVFFTSKLSQLFNLLVPFLILSKDLFWLLKFELFEVGNALLIAVDNLFSGIFPKVEFISTDSNKLFFEDFLLCANLLISEELFWSEIEFK